MKLSEAGQRVFEARYAMRDEQGNIIETFDQAVERLARAAASKESRIMRVMLISYTQKGWKEWMEKKKPEMQDIPSRLEGDVSEGY